MEFDPTLPLVTALSQLASAGPDHPAITCRDETISRGELDRRTNRLARAYIELGVRPDSFVTIVLPNGIEFYEAAVATWKAGATPQPLSASLPQRERDAIIELADPSLVVGIDPAELPGRVAVPAGFDATGFSDEPLIDVVAAASLKAPTSGGSTGRPKIIVSTQAATVDAVAPFARLLGMTDNGVLLCTGPLSHNAPFLMSFCGLVLGGHIVVMPRFVAEDALALVEQHRVDWMYTVPTMLARIWKLPNEVRTGSDLSSLRVVMHMAAPCPPWLKREWIDWLGGERIWELYGATEVQSVTVVRGDEWVERPGTVGKPVVGEMQIRNEAGAVVGPGEVGELWMRRGAGVANPYRYIGAEAKASGDGWESVGDMASMDADGYVFLADRDSDMILVGGANVYPAEVEAALMEHPQVRSAVVIGLRDDDMGQVPHALVELDGELGDEELAEHIASRLVRYKQPRSYERVDGPLRDDAGKVRRTALAAERTVSDGDNSTVSDRDVALGFLETCRRILLIPTTRQMLIAVVVLGMLVAVGLVGLIGGGLAPGLGVVVLGAGLYGAIGEPARLGLWSVVPAPMRKPVFVLLAVFLFLGILMGALLFGGVDRRYGSGGTVVAIAIPAIVGSLLLARARRSRPEDLERMAADARADEELAQRRARGEKVPMLSCRGIDFSYKQLQVLFDVDFTVDDGEMVALLGTNGAGKSTLLKVISGIGLPSKGSVRYRGHDITYVDAERRVRLGITQIPGGRAVFGPMSIVENLRTFGYTVGQDRRRLDAALDDCFAAFPRLAERRNSLASTLSGGEQQMLGLSKALILQPRLLLIDELSLGLAPIIVGQLLDMVRRINKAGTAIVLVEQSVNIALNVVDHAYFMEKGEMRFDGPAPELVKRDDLLRAVFLQGAAKATSSKTSGRR